MQIIMQIIWWIAQYGVSLQRNRKRMGDKFTKKKRGRKTK